MTEYLKRFREYAEMNPWPDTKDMPCYIGIEFWRKDEIHVCKLFVDHKGGNVLIEPMTFLSEGSSTAKLWSVAWFLNRPEASVNLMPPHRSLEFAAQEYIAEACQNNDVRGIGYDSYQSNALLSRVQTCIRCRGTAAISENYSAAIADLESLSRRRRLHGKDCALLKWNIANAIAIEMTAGGDIFPCRNGTDGPSIAGFHALIAANIARLYPTVLGHVPAPRPKPEDKVAAPEAKPAPRIASIKSLSDVQFARAPELRDVAGAGGVNLEGREFKALKKAGEEARLSSLAADIKELRRRGVI